MNTSLANRLTPYMFLAPAAAILLVALLYPLGYVFYASFLNWNPSQRIGQAEFVGLRNYINLFHDDSFRESFFVTLRFSAIVVSLEMLIGVGLAFLLDRNIRGMSALRTLFILPIVNRRAKLTHLGGL
ncbi:carbohydrate ABC transporter permease [Profundibacter sp.]|uniref:carbohydrate ABC transporter permease n=1 Tax=Profundibacter sp. TaxID=3101071 RepID=UPI003D1280C3